MEVRRLLVHVQYTRNHILCSESITQPFQIGICPSVKMTLLYNLHHLLVGAGQDNTDSLCLVLADLAVKTDMVDTVLDSLVILYLPESYIFPVVM